MKGLGSIEALAERLLSNAQSRTDVTADVKDIRAEVANDKFVLNVGDGKLVAAPNGVANQQLAEFTDIPKRYYDRCLEQAPDVLASQVNRWFCDKGEKRRLVRTFARETGPFVGRAFLSDGYQRIDHDGIARVAVPLLQGSACQLISTEITERRFYLHATTPRITTDIKVGDTVQAGVRISNSEVGCGAFSVEYWLYRLRCLNGMVGGSLLRQIHLGRAGDNEGVAFLSDQSKKLDDAALLSKLRDAVRYVLSAEGLEEQVRPLRLAAGIEVKRPDKAIEVVAAKFQLTESEKQAAIASFFDSKDFSVWGVANAVTALANENDDYDRATELQSIGRNVIDLPRSAWDVKEAA